MSAPAGARVELVDVDADSWDGLLDELGAGDSYLRRGYVEASAVLEPGRPVLLHLDAGKGHCVFACLVRDIPGTDGRRDVTTPYGYGGPVAVGGAPAAAAAAFHAAYERWCRENDVVTTFVRYHPLFDNRRFAPPRVRLERLADTVIWRLDRDRDLWAGMHQMHRRGARKAERAGVAVSVARGPERLDDFAAFYEDAMSRLRAHGFYFFGPAYWNTLATGLGDALVRVDARLGDELLSSKLLLASRPWVHYHLGATSERGFALGASKLAFAEAARWAQGEGFAELHLGGGLGSREDSLFEFKRRFTPDPRRTFWIGKLVHDRAVLRELAGTDSLEGFFPAYRAHERARG